MEAKYGSFPVGYTGQGKRGLVLKPPVQDFQTEPVQQQEIALVPMSPSPVVAAAPAPLAWNSINDYDSMKGKNPAARQDGFPVDLAPIGSMPQPLGSSMPQQSGIVWGTAPMQPRQPQGKKASEGVTVFSLDEDTSAFTPNYSYVAVTSPLVVSGGEKPRDFASAYGQLIQQLYFQHNSAAIAKTDAKKLQQLADALKRTTGDVAVTVEGHASKRVDSEADPVRKKMINFEIALERANMVTRELKKSGVNPNWVKAVSKGDDEPNPNPGDRAQEDADRRAEVYMNSK